MVLLPNLDMTGQLGSNQHPHLSSRLVHCADYGDTPTSTLQLVVVVLEHVGYFLVPV